MSRTPAYHATVHSLKDPIISQLRAEVKIKNLEQKLEEAKIMARYRNVSSHSLVTRYRVVVRGRLGKYNKYADLYKRGGPLWRYSSQTIRPEHATRFDVYVHSYLQDIKVK
jgi:hypothetical protein